MKKKLSVLLAFALAGVSYAVTLEQGKAAWTVKSKGYTAHFEKAHGYRVRFSRLGGRKVNYTAASSNFYQSGERDKWVGQYAADDALVTRSRLKVTPKVVSSSNDKIVLEFSYAYSGGKVTERVTLDDSDVIRYDVSTTFTRRLSKHEFNVALHVSDLGGIFYPDRKRVAGVWMTGGNYVEGPSWRYAWFEKVKIGVGLVALPNKYLAGIEYSMQNRKEGWGANASSMKIVHSPLSRVGKSGKFNWSFLLIAGSNPAKAQAVAEKYLGKKEAVSIVSYETEKLTIRPGETNKMLVELENTTKKNATVKTKTFVIYGLDTEKLVAEGSLNLKAGEYRKHEIPVKFPAEATRGVAIRTELYDAAGKLLDKKTEFCSITDFSPRDTGFGIINAGQVYQHGSQHAWNHIFKKNYVGSYEYYCWAPSTIFGLAPKEERWIPHTEAGYSNPLSKAFLKGLIDDAHSKGVGVYAWITSLWNYKVGIQHPDMIQYCENGQPNVYNGSLRKDGSRRMVLKANMYTPERAAMWGNEMADSIAMFGWDGCRWDASFIPGAANDPLYMGHNVSEWYNNKGVPQSKLYPDPDKTGEIALRAWREAIAKRYPNFIYGTNYNSGAHSWKLYPLYHKESARNALVLFEDMLNYSNKEFCTFDLWGGELAKRCDQVRPYNAAPVVGAMRGLPINSVSYQLANYTCASAGVKWWSYASRRLKENAPVRNRYLLRFARYYFGTEFMRPAKLPVSLAAKQNVLFEPFVRERKTDDGREIVIPVVNMPDENRYICEFHQEPSVKKNLSFRIALKSGESAVAWVMTPQNPEKAVKVPVKNGVVSVPVLKDACMVLIQCKGGK